MKECTQVEIKRLQDNLSLIRNAGGWTTEEFGDMIGVTKQTISNLENNKTTMTKTQYIAIRAVLDYEMSNNPENSVLASAVDLCLNKNEITKDEKKKMQAFMMGAKKTGLDSASVVAGLAALVGVAATEVVVSPVVIGAAGSWLAKIISTKKKGRLYE